MDLVELWKAEQSAYWQNVARSIRDEQERECDGHPAGPFDPMGVTVYCDGSCKSKS